MAVDAEPLEPAAPVGIVGSEPVLREPTVRASNQLVRKVGWYLGLTLLSVLILFPIYLTIVRALSPPIRYFNAGSPLHPVDTQWSVFGDAWNQGNIGTAMWRSLLM